MRKVGRSDNRPIFALLLFVVRNGEKYVKHSDVRASENYARRWV